jgi:hypothetical protein
VIYQIYDVDRRKERHPLRAAVSGIAQPQQPFLCNFGNFRYIASGKVPSAYTSVVDQLCAGYASQ